MSFDLLIGGVRSGKSRLAVRLGERSCRPVTMIATAEDLDDEMSERIVAHQAERPASWTTIEEPCAIADAIERADLESFLLLDCLTVWTANMMHTEVPEAEILACASAAARLLADRSAGAVVVTNEVGMGVHPFTDLGRRYRDVLGAVNVRFGTEAERVGLVMAGRILPLASADEWAR